MEERGHALDCQTEHGATHKSFFYRQSIEDVPLCSTRLSHFKDVDNFTITDLIEITEMYCTFIESVVTIIDIMQDVQKVKDSRIMDFW